MRGGKITSKIVFVSSTFEDLKQHRKAIWDLLGNFDVNVRGMEQFGARKERSLEVCLAEVEQSDIYIGIMGFRYGSVDSKSGKSYTQLEYEKANELDKDIKIYFADENAAQFAPNYIDRGKEASSLDLFKKLLKERHTIPSFSSVNDLIEKLDRDIKPLLSSKKTTVDTNGDEFIQSQRIIEHFLLTPALVSGKEVKLKVGIGNKPYPASKDICTAFNLDFGATIVIDTIIDVPATFKDSGLNELLIECTDIKYLDKFLKYIEGKKTLDIYAKLLFSRAKINSLEAKFKEKVFYSITAVKDPTWIIEDAEGKIALLLSKMI